MYSNIKALQEKKKNLLVQVKSSNYAHKKYIQNTVHLMVGSHLFQS